MAPTLQRYRFPRVGGVALPLSSLRGVDDSGTGEILDLIPFVEWLARWHQRIVQLLPINESAPAEASPYTSISAFAIDPSYISVSRVVDVERSGAAQQWLRSGRARREVGQLRRAPQRSRQAVCTLKLQLLALGFDEFAKEPAAGGRAQAFARFHQLNAWWIDDYALFRALKEQQQWTSWETWPDPLRLRDAEALAQAAEALGPRIRFFQYMQWIAAEQWAQVRRHARAHGVLIKGDLPFVCGRDSADVWAHPELFDLSSSAGAPPDAFSSTGQAWGLPLYQWSELRRTAYQWWRQRARQARDLYDVFRVDHVVGLYRTYAIPVQEGGTTGFVPADEQDQLAQGEGLLSAVLEEAGEASGVVAEDLGTVPDWVRASLMRLGIPGYKVFRWEQREGVYIDPRAYPPLSIATTGTHDTDSLVTWWQELDDNECLAVARVLDLLSDTPEADGVTLPWTAELHLALLSRLYAAGSALTILPVQDLFGWSERINLPATMNPDNWNYRLPTETNALDRTPEIRQRMEAIRAMIDAAGRSSLPAPCGNGG